MVDGASCGQPLSIRNRRLRNRVVLAPMDRNYCEPDGRLTAAYTAYLAERAAGGAALVFPEAAYVRIDGKCQTHQMGLHDDSVVPGLGQLADAVHAEGALLGVQLNHGGNTSKPSVSGYRPVSPSGVACRFAGGFEPDVLEHEDVVELAAGYAAGARRAVDAGVDVLMVHAAHGYLIHQFMMRRTNLRDDEFGDPVRFLELVVLEVRAVAPELPIFLRISADDDPVNGLDRDTMFEIVRRAPLEAIDCIDVSAGSYEAPEWIIPVGERPEGWLRSISNRYRQLGPAVSVAGRIATLDAAAEILAEGAADLVSVARAFHADPRWASELLGASSRPRPCIACNLCIDELGRGPIRCAVNPRAGHELEIADDPQAHSEAATGASGQVLVVGAGPAGMELARRLALADQPVRLVDRADCLGGQFALASGLRCYPQYHRILDWYADELARLWILPELGIDVDEEWLLHKDPATVVLATGGRGFMPEIPGIELPRVHDVRDWLRTGADPDGGTFVVWGGDREGLAVADDLLARGAYVTVVVAGERFARDAGRIAKALVTERLLDDPRCSIRYSSRIAAVTPDSVRFDEPSGKKELGGPLTVLVSQGVEADDALRRAARRLSPPGGVHLIGDAAGMGGSFADAIAGSVRLANNLVGALTADARA